MFPLDPVKPLKPTQGLQAKPVPGLKAAPDKVPGFKAAPGRPATNVGQYLIKPTPEQHTGYEMLNTEPQVIGQVEEQFMKKWELPPALQPKYLRKPEIMENQRKKAISKGFVKPRSHQG
jgi:hypothetical protein